jgi:hypothetical protein
LVPEYAGMAEGAVLNWDRVVHKNVRTSDRSDVGTIIQVAGDNIRIMQGVNRQYNVPKSHVDGFDGSEVYLDIPYSEMARYKTT